MNCHVSNGTLDSTHWLP